VDVIEPLAGPPGTTITLSGRHLTGWRGYVDVDGRSVASAIELSTDSFSVALPSDLVPGFHQLRVDVSRLFARTFFFEVAP
jgi:hypothetical protein